MRLLHLADLHIGKRVNDFNLLEDQKYILDQIIQIAQAEQVRGVLIAGDVYDKSQPSAEAVELLDYFITELTKLNLLVFMISGNHDSTERLSFGNQIFHKSGIYISGSFTGTMEKITIEDEYGPINIFLLPFLKPAQVRPFFEDKIENYDQAIRAVLSTQKLNLAERNILVAHQFVISGSQEPERSDSEAISVGGLDSVDTSAFVDFDYVALGHLHRPQKIGSEVIRYGGSPLKYSFSEARQEKSVTILELGSKGRPKLEKHLLRPLRDLREIKGPLKELLAIGKKDNLGADDYLKITLTDEEEIYDALGQLRQVYPNLMVLDFENSRTEESNLGFLEANELIRSTPLDLFVSFYEQQNNEELKEQQRKILKEVIVEAGVVE